MTLPILALATLLFALALWLVATRRRPPTMDERERAFERELREREKGVR